jgi:hypothetical protein
MPVGAPAMLRLARRWGGPDVRGAALLRGVDVEGAALLVLDTFDALHLVALRDRLFLSVRETLMSWSSGEVRVVIAPNGGPELRMVELHYGESTLVAAGPWRSEAQRDALELIERVTLTAREPAWRRAR